MKKREIGSNFYLSTAELSALAVITANKLTPSAKIADERFLSSGRQAIRFCLRDLQQDPEREEGRKVAILPELTCASVIQPFQQENYELYFYPLQQNLKVSFAEINRLSEQYRATVVLFHPYFGFDTMVQDEVLRSDVKYIYDATHSFYSCIDYPQVDYQIASIRKWGAFLDGGYCSKLKSGFYPQDIRSQDTEMLAVQEEAYRLKAEYISAGQGDKARFLELYRQASDMLKTREEIHEMSVLAQNYYFSFDETAMKEQRRSNYEELLSFPGWADIGEVVFPDLSATQVPLYFPFFVRDEQRDLLQSFLIKEDIYAPVIWPLPSFLNTLGVSAASQWIYDHMLVLPIDQRYRATDMIRIKAALSNFLNQR